MFMEKTPELLPPNPSLSPGRALARRGAQGCQVHLREDVRACQSVTACCCFVICTNWPDRMEAGRIAYPIPEHAWIQRELKQCSSGTHTPSPPGRRGGEKKPTSGLNCRGRRKEPGHLGTITLGTRTEFSPGNSCQVGLSFLPPMEKRIDSRQTAAVAGTALLTLRRPCASKRRTGDWCQFLPHRPPFPNSHPRADKVQ